MHCISLLLRSGITSVSLCLLLIAAAFNMTAKAETYTGTGGGGSGSIARSIAWNDVYAKLQTRDSFMLPQGYARDETRIVNETITEMDQSGYWNASITVFVAYVQGPVQWTIDVPTDGAKYNGALDCTFKVSKPIGSEGEVMIEFEDPPGSGKMVVIPSAQGPGGAAGANNHWILPPNKSTITKKITRPAIPGGVGLIPAGTPGQITLYDITGNTKSKIIHNFKW